MRQTRKEIAHRYYEKHKKACKKRTSLYNKLHPNYQKQWRKNLSFEKLEKYRLQHRKYEKTYYQNHRLECLKKRSDYRKQYPEKVHDVQKKCGRRRHNQLKIEVLTHYGGNPPKCACCGEPIIEFLTIDHIHGGGTQHRKLIGYGNLYRWLIKNNFPEGFQVLCANCQLGKRIKGVCPHEDTA